jgi:hypothetical protein
MAPLIRRSYCGLADVRTRVCPPGELPGLELVECIMAAIASTADEMNEAFEAAGARLPYGAIEWKDAREINALGATAMTTSSVVGMAEFRALVQAMCVRLGGKAPEVAPEAPTAARSDERPAAAADTATELRGQHKRRGMRKESVAE